MKIIFQSSLAVIALLVSSTAFAATGTGHAQAVLDNPLALQNLQDVNLGTIAIDPGAGAQTVSIDVAGSVTCPATYVCSGSPTFGVIEVTGAPSSNVDVSITGATATLDDGSGNTLTFDPVLTGDIDTGSVLLDVLGGTYIYVGGSIDFLGTETAGTYTSQNGSGYTVTVNY
ncbi:MAG: DUF4402 domain-containing protein [Alphaproteobacteria bacterium]|nr:DUF4402 domain-containing protein [Alphaproteobacteria bacterium]MBN2780063.1 DUF4402 domain-containing protein [Alphaproteobacteria bacterium]